MGINKEKYFNYVKEFFKQNKCELLTIFDNFTNKYDNNLKFKCKCGNIEDYISFKWYSRSVHKTCKKCILNNNPRRINEYNNTVEYFKKYDCELLTPIHEYKNNRTKNLNYRCKCNNIVKNESYILYYLSYYKCCDICRIALINKRYHSFDEIKETFSRQNVELLTTELEYKGINNTRFCYKCKCGKLVNNINYHSFMLSKYKQCKNCVKKLIKQTCFVKYGYEIPMHHPDVLNNCINKQYYLKNFKFPSGVIIKVQGYEDLALKILIEEECVDEKDIITDRKIIPCFNYQFKSKTKKYLPDIFIQSQNKIIEVKSDRTFNMMYIQNILKALAARKAGYNFEFWIFNKVTLSNTPNYKYNKSTLKLTKI